MQSQAIQHPPLSNMIDSHIDHREQDIRSLQQHGYAYLPGTRSNFSDFSDWQRVRHAYSVDQQEDPDPGNRWRSHSRVRVKLDGGLELLPHATYAQSYEDNPDAAGKQRRFAPIPADIIAGQTFSKLINETVSVGRALYPDIDEAAKIEDLKVGLHMVRYRPHGKEASFSSPISIHRDTERVVMVAVLGVSQNLGGGENIISMTGRDIIAILNMRTLGDSLLLTRKGFHAVMPMYAVDGTAAFRDILLVTID